MRVLFIKSRSVASKVTASTPPLGILYLSAYVKKHLGALTRVLDLKFERDPRRAVADAVASFRPDAVGVSGLTAEAFLVHESARQVRAARPDVPVLVGGPHATSDAADVLGNAAVDVAVLGEGEQTLLELLTVLRDHGAAWRQPQRLAAVKGIAYRDEAGRVCTTPARPFLDDLDALPFPDWDAIDLKRFWVRPGMATIGIRPYVPMFTSRGCPFHCTYCHNLFGKRFRPRSPQDVIAEIEEITRRYGPVDLEFLDDIANLKRERLNAIFQGLLDRGLHPRISFPNGVRTDLLDRETIELYARVGAGEVSVAVETASPRLQKQIRKNLDLDKVRQNLDLLVEHGVFTRGFFMLGFPTETLGEMLQTVRFAVGSRLHLALFFAVNPFKGTDIVEAYRAEGKAPVDASHGDYEYFGAPFNGSEVPDALFRWIYRYAYYRFYLDPVRVARILKDRPYRADIPRRVGLLFKNLTSFRRVDDRQASGFDPEGW